MYYLFDNLGGRPHVRYPEFTGHVTVCAAAGSNGQVFPPFFITEGVHQTKEAKNEFKRATAEGRAIPNAQYVMGGKHERGTLKGQINKASMTRRLFRQYIKDLASNSV